MQRRGAKLARRTDGSGGFERFGWAPPLLDDQASTFISQAFQRADAFLLGRRTYEIFAGSWERAWIRETPSERR